MAKSYSTFWVCVFFCFCFSFFLQDKGNRKSNPHWLKQWKLLHITDLNVGLILVTQICHHGSGSFPSLLCLSLCQLYIKMDSLHELKITSRRSQLPPCWRRERDLEVKLVLPKPHGFYPMGKSWNGCWRSCNNILQVSNNWLKIIVSEHLPLVREVLLFPFYTWGNGNMSDLYNSTKNGGGIGRSAEESRYRVHNYSKLVTHGEWLKDF